MKYKILKRIQNGQLTVGYQLLSEDRKILNISKDQGVHAAYQGLIVNATYNNSTKSISGTHNTDLRSLPVIQYSEIVKNKTSDPVRISNKHKTNHELAQDYMTKQKLLGVGDLIKIELLSNDRVKLLEVLDKESTGSFTLPSFITEQDYSELEGPFRSCRFEEIIINHDYTDWTYLFSSMSSKKLSINYQGKPIESLNSTFNRCESLEQINLNNLDTSNVTDMSHTFAWCKSLKQIDISSFDTSNVTDMSHTFAWCKSLKQIDISSFDTRNVTNMKCMFYGCESLKQIDPSSFDTRKVTDMERMFGGCESLKQLDLSSLDIRNVTDMGGMFARCKSLKQLDLGCFDTSNVTNMSRMFSGCESLKQLDLSSFNTSNVISMLDMFYRCKSLEQLDLSSFNTSKATNMWGMLGECKSLECMKVKKGSSLKYKIDSSKIIEV